MTREELIKKWLDNDLSPEELKAFNALDDAQELNRLSDGMKAFKAPEYDTSEVFASIKQTIAASQVKPSINWTKQLLRFAAIFVIGFSLYYYSTTLDTNISTTMAEKTSIELPDASLVTINALTDISFNKKNWIKNRFVKLNGEAYFKVAKGATFNVETPSGIVSVLGTQFNVKHRENLFEVVCYEGSVNVNFNNKNTILKPGDSFLLLDGEIIATEKENIKNPSWINNQSYFKSMPLSYVLNEFERQYNVTVESQQIDTKQVYTGSFVHDNMELALKSITLPLNIKFSKKDPSTIVLISE
ncbi:MAG: FecR family protein [Flavobacteriaceae bacterium]|nr:FecR family protein [Flavobacteriaceae bacterium]